MIPNNLGIKEVAFDKPPEATSASPSAATLPLVTVEATVPASAATPLPTEDLMPPVPKPPDNASIA